MGTFTLDAYKDWTVDDLKKRCRELVRINMHKDMRKGRMDHKEQDGQSAADIAKLIIDETTQPYLHQINETPALLSLLYDMDLLPEQIQLPVNAMRMAAFCEMFKRLTPEAVVNLFQAA